MLSRIAKLLAATALALGLTTLGAASVRAEGGGGELNRAPAAHDVGVDETLGAMLDQDLRFTNHHGDEVKLGDFFDGERPVLITLNYYRCPTLCNLQLNSLTTTLQNADWKPGENYRIVTVSIDPNETAELAARKRASHLEALGLSDREGAEIEWHFLVGDALQVRMLAAQLGVGYAYDPEQDQYAHPAVLMFVSPEGKVARYVYGLEYAPSDIKFALMEAAEGRVGSPVDRLILSCFHYDASIGKYGPFAMGIMRLGGGITVLIVGSFLLIFWRRERRRTRRQLLEA